MAMKYNIYLSWVRRNQRSQRWGEWMYIERACDPPMRYFIKYIVFIIKLRVSGYLIKELIYMVKGNLGV